MLLTLAIGWEIQLGSNQRILNLKAPHNISVSYEFDVVFDDVLVQYYVVALFP